jgi:hypothetical protein
MKNPKIRVILFNFDLRPGVIASQPDFIVLASPQEREKQSLVLLQFLAAATRTCRCRNLPLLELAMERQAVRGRPPPRFAELALVAGLAQHWAGKI